jgi:hypothetical protein
VLVCPRCQQSLQLAMTLHLGPDGFNDEFNFQLVTCRSCKLFAAGYYEESRRGSDDRSHHRAIEISFADWQTIATDIQRCPAPTSPHCACAIHRQYGETDAMDVHRPLRDVQTIGDWFDIEYRS